MSKHISIDLIKKYLANSCSADEVQEVHDWFNSFSNYPDDQAMLPDSLRAQVEEKIFSKITQQIADSESVTAGGAQLDEDTGDLYSTPNKRWTWKSLSIAAMVFFCLGSIYYLTRSKPNGPEKKPVIAKAAKDVAPGGNKALLRLGNGSVIVLDSASNGVLATQGTVKINKTKSGQIVYTFDKETKANGQSVALNTISTPDGGQYQIVLPDGTTAWLNSRSSLSFPTSFQGDKRRVTMQGEVYFEVAKNPAMPFVVKSKNTEIEVLGTHFNIMAYDDEKNQKTTLLEGAIKIKTDKISNILKPGQQAITETNGDMKIKTGVDTDAVIAWKNGFFDFKNSDLATIMRQASRWYSINPVFEDQTADIRFTGRIPRNVNLSQLLSMLQYTGIKYNLDGNSITFHQ